MKKNAEEQRNTTIEEMSTFLGIPEDTLMKTRESSPGEYID
ncbi:hypothetical protein PI125_g19617 [Phytophthora idaei]|nr:hypothetical protein PI125_g19617 [Phytophthora idaei]